MDRKAIEEHLKFQTRDPFPNTLKKDILEILDELDNARALHREEQVRSADRLKIAVDMLKKIATPVYSARTEEGALIQIEVEAMAVEALDEIKKVGVGS